MYAINSCQNRGSSLGLTAGIILGVIAFDILPGLFEIVHAYSLDATKPMIALVIGFLAFHVLEKSVLVHHVREENSYRLTIALTVLGAAMMFTLTRFI